MGPFGPDLKAKKAAYDEMGLGGPELATTKNTEPTLQKIRALGKVHSHLSCADWTDTPCSVPPASFRPVCRNDWLLKRFSQKLPRSHRNHDIVDGPAPGANKKRQPAARPAGVHRTVAIGLLVLSENSTNGQAVDRKLRRPPNKQQAERVS